MLKNQWVKQRAKTFWLQKDHDDLQFLYHTIREKNNGNSIKELHSDKGILTDSIEIRHAFCGFYCRLFNSHKAAISLDTLLVTKFLSQDQIDNLVLPILDKEIIEALQSIDDDKTPDNDGFTVKFLKFNWDLSSKQFLAAAHHFFSSKKLPQMYKHTLITFSPKSKHASSIADYCPISLCTTFYKVVAKILAHRLKPTLSLVSSKTPNPLLSKGETLRIILL